MKRTKVGGSLAAVANKHGIGKVVAKFPPVAMLTDEERAQALAVMRKGRAVKRDAREKEARDASEAAAMRAWGGKGMAADSETETADPKSAGRSVKVSMEIEMTPAMMEEAARFIAWLTWAPGIPSGLRERAFALLRG